MKFTKRRNGQMHATVRIPLYPSSHDIKSCIAVFLGERVYCKYLNKADRKSRAAFERWFIQEITFKGECYLDYGIWDCPEKSGHVKKYTDESAELLKKWYSVPQ